MNTKKLSVAQMKKRCTTKQFALMDENELVDIFRYINSRILNLQNSLKLTDIVERKWWDSAYGLLDKELCKRNMCLTYIGFTPGAEGEAAVKMLNNGQSGIDDAYTLLEQLTVPQLKNVEAEVSKNIRDRPCLYQSYLEKIREAIRSHPEAVLN